MTLFQIFEAPLTQWQKAIAEAIKSDNAALHLYKSGARNILFKLEALCRINEKVLNDKKYSKWKERFKTIEDQLGKIDYRDAMTQQFEKNKLFPKATFTNQQKALANDIEFLNTIIKEKKWVQNNCKKLIKLIETNNVEIKEQYNKKLSNFLNAEIEEIVHFYNDLNGKFTKIEEEVHEIRRRLRWISIYAQSLNGSIQLKKTKPTPSWSSKYNTPEIIQSPFNKLPKVVEGIQLINFGYNNFIALSFVINALGAIKDNGLKLHFLKIDCALNNAKLAAILGKSIVTEEKVLQKATLVCKDYFKNEIIHNLLIQ